MKPLFLFLFFVPFISFSQHMGTTTLEVKQLPPLPKKNVEIERYIAQFSESGSLSDKEKEWFYWTNYSRKNPVMFWDSIIVPLLNLYPNLKSANTNSLRKDLNAISTLPLVKPNISLSKTSFRLAKDLSDKQAQPSHTSPSGSTFADRMKEENIKVCAGENISFGSGNPVLMLVLLYIDEGVSDLGHRKSLLNPAFVEMGIGIAPYPNKQEMVVQDFACNQNL